MGRPLLTDEIIERANRGEVISDPPLVDDEETKIIRTDQGSFGYPTPQGEFNQDTMQIEVDREVVKSRRIEKEIRRFARRFPGSRNFARKLCTLNRAMMTCV